MLVYFVYDASSCTIFSKKQSIPGFFKQELGRCIVNLDPQYLSCELRWVSSKLKKLGYKNKCTSTKVCEAVRHSLVTKDTFCIEL